MTPRWFEIPQAKSGSDFERKFQLRDLDRWRELSNNDNRVWRLLVWVGEEDHKPVVNRVPDPEYRSRGAGDNPPQILVIAEEVRDWPIRILSVPIGAP